MLEDTITQGTRLDRSIEGSRMAEVRNGKLYAILTMENKRAKLDGEDEVRTKALNELEE